MSYVTAPPIQVNTPELVKQEALEKAVIAALQDAGLQDLSHAKGRYFIFNLAPSVWYDVGALLWLIVLLHTLKLQRNVIELVLPDPGDTDGRRPWDFFLRWHFFEALAKCVDDPMNLVRSDQRLHLMRSSKYLTGSRGYDESGRDAVLRTTKLLEIKTISAGSDQQQGFGIRDEQIMAGALSYVCGWEPDATSTFMRLVTVEGVQNSLLHAHGTFVNVCYNTDQKNLIVAISDNGMGIPGVLRTAFGRGMIRNSLSDDSDAELILYFTERQMIRDLFSEPEQLLTEPADSSLIVFSTKEGVGTQPDRAGAGLYYLKSHVLELGGEIRIRSGKACVEFVGDRVFRKDGLMESPGTLVRVIAPLRLDREKPMGGGNVRE